jgi:hypothetical protein
MGHGNELGTKIDDAVPDQQAPERWDALSTQLARSLVR